MDAMKRFAKKRGVAYAGTAVVAVLGFIFVCVPRPTHAENSRVITIHHDGTQQTVVTDAKTIGEALDRADVTLNNHDVVEPGTSFELVAPGYDVNVYRARPVTVVDAPKT
ncbi:MAG TPA: ubiquitin-like domain-containing protein, partial [Candidatus Saccharimonadales bacterium]|nr:ubiquitin-like domain-containing protein [Candidatus Saccharimonadales bacterium]